MGEMTGQALSLFHGGVNGHPFLLEAFRKLGVAGQAQALKGFCEVTFLGGPMRIMAFEALSRLKGLMNVRPGLDSFGNLRVASVTPFSSDHGYQ
jgi:hypothetical protein